MARRRKQHTEQQPCKVWYFQEEIRKLEQEDQQKNFCRFYTKIERLIPKEDKDDKLQE